MSRPTQDPDRLHSDFAYGALTLSGASSQMLRLSSLLPLFSPTTPHDKSHGLGSFRFARRYSGNRFFFLFLQLLRCFSSLRIPLMCYLFTHSVACPHMPGSPIRISPDLCLLTAPRSFSQFVASFIGFQCQGIRRAPFFT